MGKSREANNFKHVNWVFLKAEEIFPLFRAKFVLIIQGRKLFVEEIFHNLQLWLDTPKRLYFAE